MRSAKSFNVRILVSALVGIPILFCTNNSVVLKLKSFIQPELVSLLPYFLLGAVGFLGQKLNLYRVFIVALIFVSGFVFLTKTNINAHLRIHTFSFGMLSALLLTSNMKLHRIGNKSGLFKILGVFIPAVVFYFLVKQPIVARAVSYRVFNEIGLTNLSDWILPFVVANFIFVIVQRDLYLRAFQLYALAAVMTVLTVIEMKSVSKFEIGLAYTSASALLLVAIFQVYWQKIYIDELTGIPNRRALNEALLKLGQRFTIAMVDVDHFKKFNDTWGHDEGDNVLRYVGRHLDSFAPGKAYRYGGEEFTILYDGEEPEDVRLKVDEIREKLSEKDFIIRSAKAKKRRKKVDRRNSDNHDSKSITQADTGVLDETQKVQVTVSIGVASNCDAPRSVDEVFKAADQALYKAKKNGRNQVALT
ncbi:MAG: GGDEF domain-containing protein [Bacteriovoracia bacterium]